MSAFLYTDCHECDSLARLHRTGGLGVPIITDPRVARELLEHIDWTPERAARYRAQRREDETP